MSDTTARFAIPLLAAGQAQKEMTHNEAITALEAIAQPIAESAGDDLPPTSPDEGQSWIIGASPSGAWAGHPGALATWTAGGWRFAGPIEGMAAFVKDQGLIARRGAAGWTIGPIMATEIVVGGATVVNAQQPAIPGPVGGTVVDVQARTALAALLTALETHGLIAAA